jgi:DNA-binding transcriptional regulator YiaG
VGAFAPFFIFSFEEVLSMTQFDAVSLSSLDSSEIKQARLKLGWSQSQLAAALGLSVATVEAWEQGRRSASKDIGNIVLMNRANMMQCFDSRRRLVLSQYTLKEARKLLGFTIQEICKMTGRSVNTMRSFEKGARTPPDILVCEIERMIEERVKHLHQNNPFHAKRGIKNMLLDCSPEARHGSK